LQSIVISETQAETLGTASSNSARRRGTPRFAPRDRRYWSRNQSAPQRSEFSRPLLPGSNAACRASRLGLGPHWPALAALLTEADLIGPKAFRENCKEAVGRPAWRQCRVMPADASDPPATARRSVLGAREIGSAWRACIHFMQNTHRLATSSTVRIGKMNAVFQLRSDRRRDAV
jgi:hypothetical protein